MRSKVAERMLAKMPEDIKIFTDKYADLIVLINHTLKEKGLTQKALADRMDKRPSEIHKWLSGEHNFTLRSVAKLEAELGLTLLEVPNPKKTEREFTTSNGAKLNLYVNKTGYASTDSFDQTDWLTTNSKDFTKELSHGG